MFLYFAGSISLFFPYCEVKPQPICEPHCSESRARLQLTSLVVDPWIWGMPSTVFRVGSWPIKAWADQANVYLQNTTVIHFLHHTHYYLASRLDSATAIFTCYQLSPVIRSSHQPDPLCSWQRALVSTQHWRHLEMEFVPIKVRFITCLEISLNKSVSF